MPKARMVYPRNARPTVHPTSAIPHACVLANPSVATLGAADSSSHKCLIPPNTILRFGVLHGVTLTVGHRGYLAAKPEESNAKRTDIPVMCTIPLLHP